MDVNMLAKLGLAFAVGVSLSAGYVAIAARGVAAPGSVVVVQERCPEPARATPPGATQTVVPADWRLVQGSAGAIPLGEGGGLALQRDGLFWGGERLAETTDARLDRSVVQGHMVAPLRERLQVLTREAESRGEPVSRHANLYLDPDAPVGDLVDLMYTLGRHEVSSYQFAVAAEPGDQRVRLGLLVTPPVFTAAPSGSGPWPDPYESVELTVDLQADGVHVGRRSKEGKLDSTVLFGWDDQPMTQLERLAGEVAQDRPGKALFGADRTLPVSSLLMAMSAAAGSDCDAGAIAASDASRCHFTERILVEASPLTDLGLRGR